jgi:hypothetical protein
MRTALWTIMLLGACKGKDDDAAGNAGGDDTAGGEPAELTPAPLAARSGTCPDLSESGTGPMTAGGLERTVTVLLPEVMPASPPVTFFWHGLANAGSNPGEQTSRSLQLQQVANELGMIIVLPESRDMTIANFSFAMWEVFDQDELDLVLYDDLRTCLAETFDIDLYRVASAGFSGGSLFESVLLRERADTFSTVLEMSGGSDIENALLPNTISQYGSPSWPIPVYLATGGVDDAWPNSSFKLVDFTIATDSLQAQLLTDESYVVRCYHEQGHTVTQPEYEAMLEWLPVHVFGQPSPFETSGIDAWASWCSEPTAGGTDTAAP